MAVIAPHSPIGRALPELVGKDIASGVGLATSGGNNLMVTNAFIRHTPEEHFGRFGLTAGVDKVSHGIGNPGDADLAVDIAAQGWKAISQDPAKVAPATFTDARAAADFYTRLTRGQHDTAIHFVDGANQGVLLVRQGEVTGPLDRQLNRLLEISENYGDANFPG